MIIKLSSYKIWAFNPINNAACRCARQSDPPVRMGCLSAAAESGRALSAVSLYYAILYCSIFLGVCQLFFEKMLSCPISMSVILIIEQFIKRLVHSCGIAKRCFADGVDAPCHIAFLVVGGDDDGDVGFLVFHGVLLFLVGGIGLKNQDLCFIHIDIYFFIFV